MFRSRVFTKICMIAIALIMLVGCGIITTPNPLIGCYKTPVTGKSAYSHCFEIRNDGTFDFIEYHEDSAYISSGTYEMSLSSFDFENATGLLVFTVDSQTAGLSSYTLQKDAPNRYRFRWEADASDPSKTLRLDSMSGGKNLPNDSVSMRPDDFYEELEKWNNNSEEETV